MYLRNGLMISLNQPIELDGITYPAPINPHWFTALGITEVADPPQPDPNLYTSTRNPDGTWQAVQKPLAEIKQNRKLLFRGQALSLLNSKYDELTSLLVLANQANNTVSTDFKSKIKQVSDAYEDAVNLVDSSTDLQAVLGITPGWPLL